MVFDAARFGAAWLDIGAEQGFEGFGLFRTGLGFENEAVGFAHEVDLWWGRT
ncbi:hypothetical protein D3C86_2221030 [compost metagenome]